MTSETADITTGIPLYAADDPDHLRAAVDSVLKQTMQPETIHLVQDGPIPAPLAEVVVEYVESNDGVEHIMIPENQGLSYALNVSILQTQTKYYARMDADDICRAERLEKQVSFLESNPQIDILGTAALEFEEDPHTDDLVLKTMPVNQEEIQSFAHYRTPFIHPSVMFRTNVFAQIGLYEHRHLVEDVALWMNALRKNIGVANLSEPLLYYRTSGVIDRRSTISRTLREGMIRLRYPTSSPKLNLLKLASIGFRLLPARMQKWGYRNLR